MEIGEPIGYDELELSCRRDDKFHGMQFEASTSTLEFYGNAADYLEEQKVLFGLRANVIYRSEISCDGTYEEVYRGRLNFGKFKKTCGTTCRVAVPAEEDSCRVVFKSRFDQKVDIDSTTAFDKITGLPNYAGLGIDMDIPAKALEVGTIGEVGAGSNAINDTVSVGGYWIARPTYETAINDSIDTGQLIPTTDHQHSLDDFDPPISPQLLFEDLITCFPGEFEYSFRHAGTFSIEAVNPIAVVSIKVKVVQWDAEGNIFDDADLIQEITLPYSGEISSLTAPFDETLAGTMTIPDGIGVYSFFEIAFSAPPPDVDFNVTFNPNTRMSITATKLCPDTTAQVYLIHETLSRVVEAVTNRCIRAKSDYYGRIDSQPFAAAEDGCGGLRLLTSGLKLRQAPEDQDKFFASAKDLLEGLNGIDNIGFAIEDDTTMPGFFVLRVEPVDHFYQDAEMLVLDSIPKVETEEQETLHYSKILIGYKKWEVEEVNGLGEPNSNREYRTSLDTISNPLDATSALVTGSYPIEVTRQQSFAKSGAADTSYDNDIFLITLQRNAYDFEVEQGGITSPTNIFDPGTLLNYRLTPARNMLRWAKSVFNSYPNFGSSLYKIFFGSGTGNIVASGELTDSTCKLEAGVLAENQDISPTTFADQSEAIPLWRPEYSTFEYPLSVAQYQQLKANPYGYISYQCGNGEYEKAFIKEIKFKVAKGKATFTLIKKW